jgi:hypothetical protein
MRTASANSKKAFIPHDGHRTASVCGIGFHSYGAVIVLVFWIERVFSQNEGFGSTFILRVSG